MWYLKYDHIEMVYKYIGICKKRCIYDVCVRMCVCVSP